MRPNTWAPFVVSELLFLVWPPNASPRNVGRIERGREKPTVDLLEAFALVLDAQITALFEPLPPHSKLTPGRKPGNEVKVPTDTSFSRAALTTT